MLQAVYETVDSAEDLLDCSSLISLRDLILFTTSLVQELAKLEVHPVLLKWIAPGLAEQPVPVASS